MHINLKKKKIQKGLVVSKLNEHDGLLSCPALSSEFSKDVTGWQGKHMWTEREDQDGVFVCLFSDETDSDNPYSEATFSVTVGLLNLISIQLDKEVQVSSKIATTVINKGVWWEEGAQAFQSLCWGQEEHTKVPQPVRKASHWVLGQLQKPDAGKIGLEEHCGFF